MKIKLNLFRRSSSNDTVADGMLLHKKLSFAATEAYKLLRTNLLFTLPDEKACRVIGVTSSLRGEGKSTTSINLSYALAETGKKVLLVDADLRLPSIAKKLEIDKSPGLSHIVVGVCEPKDAIRASGVVDNWFVLPSGYIPPNPSELLGSSHMQSFINEMKKDYDFIIVDLPPVNIVSDALVASPFLDGMIVVVRENYSARRALNNCTRLLALSNVKLLGFVMTVVDGDTFGYGKYKRNRYYRGYRGYERSGAKKEGGADSANG